MAVKEAA